MKSDTSYWDIYTHDIMPRLQQIDLLLKTTDIIQPASAAAALSITLSELYLLMSYLHISSITRKTFPLIMEHGSSKICRLFARELKLGCRDTYLPAQLAYIYNIDASAVEKAFKSLGISIARSSLLMDIFKKIPI